MTTCKILGVHGIGNFRGSTPESASAALGAKWARGLGIDRSSVAVAYYAHYLRLGFQGVTSDLEALNAALNDMPRRLLIEWVTAMQWTDEGSQGWGAAPLRSLVDWLVQRVNLDRPAVERLVSVFLAEVSRYFDPHDPGPRQAARNAVATAISTYQPQIIVAHSLGSVVAYEALWSYPKLHVDAFVTLGSPLAIPGKVFPLLEPSPVDGLGAKPPGVLRWFNFADVGDAVAVPKDLKRFFRDIEIDTTISTGAFWTHAVRHYLQHNLVRAAIINSD